jgi:cbb3-type cytochrome oxidase cytochrome c subunit
LGLYPAWLTQKQTLDDKIVSVVPEDFKKYYENVDDYRAALRQGRDIYISEACWHCHSQYIRPVANESMRYGPVSTPGEYQNILQLPQLFGTRRVGPDLIREGGKRSNDWHFAHFYSPQSVEPQSVMPVYTWYFDKDAKGVVTPKKEAIALVAYVQWLGSWLDLPPPGLVDAAAITRPMKNGRHKLLFMLLFSLMTLAGVLWLVTVRGFDTAASYLGAGYMMLNIIFLGIQFIAFVGAHTGYDESIEQVKMDVILAERDAWK